VVLALVTDAFGSDGGISQYNRDLASALARAPGGGPVHLLPRRAPQRTEDIPAGVSQHRARLGRLAYAFAAWRLAARLKPDQIVCGHLYMAPLAWALARLTGARLIIQAHGIEAWESPGPIERWAVERADLVLAVSRDTRARLLTWARLEPERVRVASNTMAEDFAPGDSVAARKRFGLGDDFVLLTVGRLDGRERYKGQDHVIRLLRRLESEGLKPLYLIAGHGDDRRRLATLARRQGVAGRVRFLGHVCRKELPDLYRAADLFVLPSSGEGFGIVLLEAMASGTPTVTTAAGGAADPVADGELGVVVEGQRLLPGLAQACQDRKLGRLAHGEGLSRKVRERFGRAAFERRIRLCLEQPGRV
jgi:phosphatidylinositol alpha-1,6-mannosyltransferase